MSLPDDGERVFVFVPSMHDLSYLRNMIGDLRGARLVKNCKFHYAGDIHEALRLMRSCAADRVFADHAADAAISAIAWRKEFAGA